MSISKYIQRSRSLSSPTSVLSHPDLSVRYSRRLLFVGGVAATITVVAIFSVSGTMLLIDFFQDRTNVFEHLRDKVKTNVERNQGRLKQAVESYELLQHVHQYAGNAQECSDKEPGHEPVIDVAGPALTVTPAMIFSFLNYDIANRDVTGDPHITRELSSASLLHYRDVGYSLSGFVYSADRKLLALSPPLSVEQMSNLKNYGVVNYVDFTIDMVEAELSKLSPDFIRQNRVVWLPIYKSPVTSELIGHYAAPVYCGEKRIAVIVATFPVDKFSVLFQDTEYQPGFFLLSRNFGHVLGGRGDPAEDKLARLALKYKADFDKAGRETVVLRRGGIFIYSKLIPGPDWVAIYVFDWYAVASALKKPLINSTVLMFLILSALWGFILFFDRHFLTPLTAQARIIYDSDEFNRVVLNTAPVALTIYEPTNDIVVLQNRQAIKLLELSSEGESLYKRVLLEDDFWSDSDCVERGPFGAGEVREFEVDIQDDKGRRREISVTYSRARYKQVAVVLLGMTDISEQKSTMRYLQKAKEAADNANSAKSMFLATISHEIRTPLHGALGNLELLALERLTRNQRGRVSTIHHAFDSLLALVNDVLDLSKIEAQEFKLNTELFLLSEVIERCARTFSPAILQKRLRFLCLIDPRLGGSWRGDAKRLSQVLMNLLSNAQKFTEHGSITLRVTLGKVEDDGQWVHISVSDAGIGISQEGLENLFEPFAQADQTIGGRFGGTGLGLALCRRITSLMGGHISVDSELGEGSIFKVDLPLKPEGAISTEPAEPAFKRFDTVVLVCDSPLWELNLVEHISFWFPDVKIIASSGSSEPAISNQAAILVLAISGNSKPDWCDTLRNRYVDVVNISADGPLYPERREEVLCVTSFSTSMLKLALLACTEFDNFDELTPLHTFSSAVSRNARVLVAEDDALCRKLLQCQLNALGYHNVDCVTDGAQALDKCRVSDYEVVITDLGMPIMDGYTFLKKLRIEGIGTPVIISTADVGEEACSSYNFEVLYKPTTMEQLSLLLEKVLGDFGAVSELKTFGPLPATTLVELQTLFSIEWEADANSLRDASNTRDPKRLMGLLHRLKGALLVLNEPAAAGMCDELRVCLETHDMASAWSKINDLIDKVSFIVDNYESQS